MIDVDAEISRLERVYRQLTGNEPSRRELPLAPIPPGVSPEDYVQERLRRLDRALNGTRPSNTASPRVTIYEGEEEWRCAVELPGVRRSDLSVELGLGALRITGTRELPGSEKAGLRPTYSESAFGRFEREVPVPPALDERSLEAKLENGVLLVSSRKDRGQRKEVKIEVA
ncbi:MAG: Hsp20/alpha crystallin family protein [Myxococcales bacterium]|nr:Hsp20/alpha crystallin family protein [Myxococcales bacterium]